MFGNHTAKWLGLLVLLIVANIGYYLYNNWGLVTVKVTNAPLGKVISSIEWQAWVKIYTNLPLDTKVTMYADHVPFAEAMETLSANVDVPPSSQDGNDTNRPNRNRPDGANGRPGGFAGAPPNGGGPGAPGGPPGGRGGGFGRSAQWNLAFFVAPTSAQAKQEIREFEASDPDDNNKVYTYGTQMQFVSANSDAIAPDPRLQAWPGMKSVDSSTSTVTATQTGTNATDPPAAPVPAIQTYLQAFAQSANIWIMAPGSWTPDISSAPPPNSSIITAMKNFVSGSHGAVIQAFVLRAGRGGARVGNRGDFANDDAWADRMRNAINGLPSDQRPDALDQLNKEIQFRKDVQALPPDQRRQKMFQHFAERMIYGERLSRLSPAKRAQVYQRMVSMRAAATAQK